MKRHDAWADVLLALVAVLPLAPLLLVAIRTEIPSFHLNGDYASIELQTLLVPTGKTLLGPYSRFGFNHPGPLYFYALAPVYAALGQQPKALLAGPVLIAMASAFTVVLALARGASRAHAVGASVALALWYAAYGNLTNVPWNPFVIALPLLAFTVLVALVLAGRGSAAAPAMIFGAFAAQTHLSSVPYVGAGTLACVVALVVRLRAPRARADVRALVLAALVLVIAWSPVVVEQLVEETGNVTKIAKLFVHRPEPPQAWADAAAELLTVSTWLPRRAASGVVAREAFEPEPLRSALLDATTREGAVPVALAIVALAIAVSVVGWRRRDHATLALLASSAGGLAVALVALHNIVGPPVRYLFFWASTASSVALVGLGAGLSAAAASASPRVGPRLAALAFAASALLALRLTHASAATRGDGLYPRRESLGDAYRALVARLDRDGAIAVVHGGPGWVVAMSHQLELVKAGRPIRVMPSERWFLGRQFPAPAPGERVLHIYADVPPYALPTAPCLDTLVRVGEVVLYASPEERLECPTSPVTR